MDDSFLKWCCVYKGVVGSISVSGITGIGDNQSFLGFRDSVRVGIRTQSLGCTFMMCDAEMYPVNNPDPSVILIGLDMNLNIRIVLNQQDTG